MTANVLLGSHGPRELTAAAISALAKPDLRTRLLVDVIRACARSRVDDQSVWQPASRLLLPRLGRANARRLGAVAHAYAKAGVVNEAVLRAIISRSKMLTNEPSGTESVDPRSAAILLQALGSLQFTKESTDIISALERVLTSGAASLNAVDIANSLTGFACLQHAAELFLPAARGRIDQLVADADMSSRHITLLATAYARLSVRDDDVVGSLSDSLLRQCKHCHQIIPTAYIGSLVQALVVRLKPPPPSFKAVLETILPNAARQLDVSGLVLVVPSLAFVPGLRASRNGIGHAVFKACLNAPLTAFRPRALVGVLRAARALRYTDVDFWMLALQEVESSLNAAMSYTHETAWDACDICGVALIVARIIADALPSPDPLLAGDANSPRRAVLASKAEGAFGGNTKTNLSPVASKVLRAALNLVVLHTNALGPRDLGILAISLALANVDDADIFALISHRASELLISDSMSFGRRDIAQLLAALAHFHYRDQVLLRLLAVQAASGFSDYDKVAREIILKSFSEFGGVPKQDGTQLLEDALLEYELAHGRDTDRSKSHLLSTAVLPAESD